jgi:hypothetical protein
MNPLVNSGRISVVAAEICSDGMTKWGMNPIRNGLIGHGIIMKRAIDRTIWKQVKL